MDEIKPLLESSSNPLTRDLLRSALPDAPHPRAIGSLAVALGATLTSVAAAANASSSLAAGLSGASGASIAVGTTTAQGLTGMVAKWVVVGMASGGLVAGSASLLNSREPTPSANVRASDPGMQQPEAAKQPAAGMPLEWAPTPGSTEAPSAERARPATSEVQPSHQFRKESGKLSREVELIDGARKAVAASDPAAALAALERYERVRETGTLDREARLLRINALILRGDRALASDLANRYLQSFPNDAHASRLREFLSEGK